MTRINCGIEPRELCDQHLLAEYRELPRVRTMAVKRYARHQGTGPRPTTFTLNTGHMAFFLPFGWYLKERWQLLCIEMLYRGFNPSLNWREYPEKLFWGNPPDATETFARPLLIERIKQRLSTAKRNPTWTNRKPPEWAVINQPQGELL